jgi:hypothetical protein
VKTRWNANRTESIIFHAPDTRTASDDSPDSAPEESPADLDAKEPAKEPLTGLPTRPAGVQKAGRKRKSAYPIAVSSFSLPADVEMRMRKFIRENRVIRSRWIAGLVEAELKRYGY